MLAEFILLDTTSWPWEYKSIFNLVLAAVLGAIIGAEREYHGRSAGLRTQLLVALGSCLAMIVSLQFGKIFGDVSANASIRVDPARVAYGIMSGIGFLGAGAIIRYGVGVRGLTTAASLWCTAAVGLACGFSMYRTSVVTTGIMIFALLVMSKLDRFIPSRKYKTIQVSLGPADRNLDTFREILADKRIRIVDMEIFRDNSIKIERLTLHLSIPARVKRLDFFEWFKGVPGITQITIR